MKIYTKTGDQGQTGLFGGKRVSKDDMRIEAYGTVDELNAFLSLLIYDVQQEESIKELLVEVQNRLFTIGSQLASDPEKSLATPDLKEEDILKLEQSMDEMDAHLSPLKNFILPGGSLGNSYAHICRTITRRAERRIITLSQNSDVPSIIIRYMNRLSDYFFILSRYIAFLKGHPEVPWIAR